MYATMPNVVATKMTSKKTDSGDGPIIPRQNILDELENNGRHLHTNGDVQCIMENSQSCIPGASIRSVSETEGGGGGGGGGNVKTEMDVKQNSGIYRERIANEREECCPRRDEQDANTVANGKHWAGRGYESSWRGLFTRRNGASPRLRNI